MKDHHGCPVQATINVLSGKWKVMIVWHLSFGPKRFAQMRDLLPGITEKVLTSQLRQLQADGVLARKATADIPPRVTYFLTREGEKLVPLMEELCAWGSKHFGIKPTLSRAS
jgi:DNA-binding HxlR family transcriptional regulator